MGNLCKPTTAEQLAIHAFDDFDDEELFWVDDLIAEHNQTGKIPPVSEHYYKKKW